MTQAATSASLASQIWLGDGQNITHRGHTFVLTPSGTHWKIVPQETPHGSEPSSFGHLVSRYIATKTIQRKITHEHITPQALSQMNSQNQEGLSTFIKTTLSVPKAGVDLKNSFKYQQFLASTENNNYGYCPTISCPVTGNELTRKNAVQVQLVSNQWVTCSREGARLFARGNKPKADLTTNRGEGLSVKDIREVTLANLDKSTLYIKGQNVSFQTKLFNV